MTPLRAALAALFVSLLLTAPALAAPVKDEIRNGSFERWTLGVPDAWTLEVGTVEPSSFTTENATAVQLRAKPNLLGGHLSVLAQTVPHGDLDTVLVPGAYYELSFDAAGIYSGKGNGRATVTWTGALGNVLRVDAIEIPDSTEYAHFDARLQAPVDPFLPDVAGSATIRFMVDGQSSDNSVNLWVDAVSFGLSTPAV